MFSKLVARNSKRNQKENGLFFSSLVISVAAFYIILSLSQQDVVRFLAQMESDAVNRLLAMIPLFYGATLFILFFLIYYASKFQLERRRHEFGVYLMMGMRRSKLFALLLAEDFRSSVFSLAVGLPTAVLLSELISLMTARMVGLGIVGHENSFSWSAVLWTTGGFLWIKLVSFLLLSGKISRQEIGSLLVEAPEGVKKQMRPWVYGLAVVLGLCCLLAAYSSGISGMAWQRIKAMGITIMSGLVGTLLFFWGLRCPMELMVRSKRGDRQLHVFNFRQIQETVIHRSGAMAICSLLILAAMCCFGAGVAIARFYGASEQHVLDYTFENTGSQAGETIRQTLMEHDLESQFSRLFEMKVGNIRTAEAGAEAFQMESVMSGLGQLEPSEGRDILLNNLSYATNPYLISMNSYNELLSVTGMPPIKLDSGEAAVYMDRVITPQDRVQMLDGILEKRPEVWLDHQMLHLTGPVQTTGLVTDRSITLSFALILPDETFEYYTQGEYGVYLNGVLAEDAVEQVGLMSAISKMNQKLDQTGLDYESYLQNMGRQLFYMVAASYITIYLAIIFLIIANTIIGVQFLMGQRKANRRYRTLVRLGASYQTLCRSARKQINWYFGIPAAVALVSSGFGVRALLSGLLSSRASVHLSEMMVLSAAMIVVLGVVEYIYVTAVKKSSDRYLMSLMVPEREE